jgi:hypothetical protein
MGVPVYTYIKSPAEGIRWALLPQFVISEMAGFLNLKKLRIPISFPNLSHSYWTHYHLTGDYYTRPTRLTL